MMDAMFYEVFQEEESAIKKFLPNDISARFTGKPFKRVAIKTPHPN